MVLTDHSCVIVNYRTGRTELRRLTAHVGEAGVVVRHGAAAPSWGTVEVPAVLPTPGPVPTRWWLAAMPVLIATVAVRVIGPKQGRFRRLVRLGCCGSGLPPATKVQAVHAVRAVRRASRLVPARWACLEQSAAVALLLASAGRRAEWRHGFAADPVRLHAWIADQEGRPVEEPAETSLYTPIYTPDGPGSPRAAKEAHRE
ncbi:lasso peptide biosynthesis B2 protein [Streptomyces noursei]|uniref:lasso peptide biosynthesis B2 protein n=1 Tax=Streptomyces noursei TaxID=1971 RepID=UPI00099FE8AE|nr:lasso peptide biosynthesis B2 protein [Streptomyces noursei]